jgi:hypothetical protein
MVFVRSMAPQSHEQNDMIRDITKVLIEATNVLLLKEI